MAIDFWGADTTEHTCGDETEYWRDTDRTDGRSAGWYDGQTSSQPSLICPNTGKLTMHAAEDLRAMLARLWLGSSVQEERSASRSTAGKSAYCFGMVMLGDELHGPNGEYLAVDAVSDDMRVLTLNCCVTGDVFTRDAEDVRDDIRNHRLKVVRYGDPDVPPEWE